VMTKPMNPETARTLSPHTAMNPHLIMDMARMILLHETDHVSLCIKR
jgi:hypothetical protein